MVFSDRDDPGPGWGPERLPADLKGREKIVKEITGKVANEEDLPGGGKEDLRDAEWKNEWRGRRRKGKRGRLLNFQDYGAFMDKKLSRTSRRLTSCTRAC